MMSDTSLLKICVVGSYLNRLMGSMGILHVLLYATMMQGPQATRVRAKEEQITLKITREKVA